MIPPYQAAAEETREHELRPLQAAAEIGTSLAGGKIARRVLPFLSQFIPGDIMRKGLSKISPGIGRYIDGAIDNGFTLDDIRGYLTEKYSPLAEQEEQRETKQERNIIEQHSPELHQLILDEIKKGRTPLQAGAIALYPNKGGKNFGKIIDKLTKQHKIPWSSIVESVYGSGEMAQPQQQKQSSDQIDPALASLIQQGDQIIQRLRGAGG